jgi:hypothetical protein
MTINSRMKKLTPSHRSSEIFIPFQEREREEERRKEGEKERGGERERERERLREKETK